jgi:small-conductance mechanosensitive channel
MGRIKKMRTPDSVSRSRQKSASQIKLWEQKLLEVQISRRLGLPGATEQLAFCEQQLFKLRKELKKSKTKQLAWKSWGFSK